MIVEVLYAVDFICSLLRSHGEPSKNLADKTAALRRTLNDRLHRHYNGHWHPKAPERGSGYRCIRLMRHRIDPLLIGAGREAGLTDAELLAMLPAELTLWIDPDEVCVRFGEDGSVGVIYGGGDKPSRSDSESEDSNMSSTDYSSDPDSECQSPETLMPIDLVPIVIPTS